MRSKLIGLSWLAISYIAVIDLTSVLKVYILTVHDQLYEMLEKNPSQIIMLAEDSYVTLITLFKELISNINYQMTILLLILSAP